MAIQEPNFSGKVRGRPMQFSVLFPYFGLEYKKGLQRKLQAFDFKRILVGSASFELATPAV
ncbi:hypothetical protein [Massilia sp. PWRC2]|uniref:hypothetical protein n=1 Tax=Massilia sp. PWRC2 TaxID=2804626 RepID=UPI003CE75E0E